MLWIILVPIHQKKNFKHQNSRKKEKKQNEEKEKEKENIITHLE